MKLYLRKKGKNVEIEYQSDSNTTVNFYEDSSNVELNYNTLNNTVTLTVFGTANFLVSDITAAARLYMNSSGTDVLINSKASFDTNYPLVFPNAGSGAAQTLDQVLATGDTAVNKYANFYDSLSALNSTLAIGNTGLPEIAFVEGVLTGTPYNNNISARQILLSQGATNESGVVIDNFSVLTPNLLAYRFISIDRLHQIDIGINQTANPQPSKPAIRQKFTDNSASANNYEHDLFFPDNLAGGTLIEQTLPTDSGDIALQDAPYTAVNLGTGNYTPTVKQNQVICVDGASGASVVLDSSLWNDRKTLTIMVRSSPVDITASGSSVILGNPNINQTGLYFVSYNLTNDEFYLSHT